MWRAVRELLRAVERSLARRCEAAGNPPQDDAPSAEAWERWFVWCADYVDGLALEPAIESEIDEARNDLREAQATLVEAMPEVLAPALTEWHSGAEHAVVEGYSAYDTAEVPLPSLWLFLSLLDGTRPWQEAAEQAGIGEVAARELHRIGALVPPGEGHRELQGSSLLRLRTRDGEWISVEPG